MPRSWCTGTIWWSSREDGEHVTESVRLRAAARFLAACSLDRRLDACRRFGVEREMDADPVGRILSGERTQEGLLHLVMSVPLGVVGLLEPSDEDIAECLLGGSVAAVAGRDVELVRTALGAAGLVADCVIAVPSIDEVEVDAARLDGETLVADRTGTHRHIFLDSTAETGQATYVAVNAAAHGAADTVVFHSDYSRTGVKDIVKALEHMGKELTLVRARTLGEAVDVVDRRTDGTVETILTNSVRVLRDYRNRLDSAVLVVNASPAFAPEDGFVRSVEGYTRTRLVIDGDGQTRPVKR